jgi:hypothetical protein
MFQSLGTYFPFYTCVFHLLYDTLLDHQADDCLSIFFFAAARWLREGWPAELVSWTAER